jgi:hypothetical protein
MPCSLLKVKQSLGGTCHLHLQGQKIKQACYLLHGGFLLCSFLDPEDEGNNLLQIVSQLSMDNTALYLRRQNPS